MLYFARWKIILTVLVSVLGVFFALPNIVPQSTLSFVPGWIPMQQINLGLDLRGGSHLLLEVETKAVIAERMDSLKDDVRSALRDERIGYTGLRATDSEVRVRIRDSADMSRALEVLSALSSPIQTNLFSAVTLRDIVVEEGDGGQVTLVLSDEAVEQRVRSAVEQSIEIVRRRIDELGTTEPTIQRQGTARILVQVPGLDDPARLKTLLGQTAKLAFRLVDVSVSVEQALEGRIPADSELLFGEGGQNEPYVVKRRVMVSGEDLVDAQPGFSQQTNEPIVTFRFDTSGAKRFGNVTLANVNRPFAIVLDNKVVSAPVIREPILGGTGQISGGFSVEEANDLAILLRAGALPAPMHILEERTVGPGLGADSIAKGEIAASIGAIAVVVFMVIAYGLFGLFANFALIVNVMMIFGVLSLLQATLTLPGIAGIVLTIGMAVDANVLIFERIREEIAAGKTPISAIETGYSRAIGTILDANITTFLAAFILFQMGSGPVRGFAVTLAIGIITSVFTAVTLTRLVVSVWIRRTRPKTVPI
ncbi:Protein translocase subunit SecD [hydrothermal vent metagenome]|uniref:Protein translocase subunit SecD n=1 Tax=hydrothermal vent metagenome TaxID=652676 RepID=A0A3B0TE64_9ZZZZ